MDKSLDQIIDFDTSSPAEWTKRLAPFPKREGGGDQIHLNPALAGRILALAAQGRSLRKAFALGGLSSDTLRRYERLGDEEAFEPALPEVMEYFSVFFSLGAQAEEFGMEAEYQAQRKLMFGAEVRTVVKTTRKTTKQRVLDGKIIELIDLEETVRETTGERPPQFLPCGTVRV